MFILLFPPFSSIVSLFVFFFPFSDGPSSLSYGVTNISFSLISVSDVAMYNLKESNALVEEWMLLANITGKYVYHTHRRDLLHYVLFNSMTLYPILSCPVLSCPTQSCLVLSFPILSCAVLSSHIPRNPNHYPYDDHLHLYSSQTQHAQQLIYFHLQILITSSSPILKLSIAIDKSTSPLLYYHHRF